MDEEKTQTEVVADTQNASRGPKNCLVEQQDLVSEDRDENLVDFDGSDDPSNPVNWSRQYKWTVVMLISLMTLTVNFATIICAPAAPQILAEFHESNGLYSTLLISIWELGEVAGPLLLAPLAEIYGKFYIYHFANILFICFSIGGGTSQNLNMLIAFRFLNGLSVASQTLNPSIVGDMFVQEERGRPLSIMGYTKLLGPVLGPVIGGYLSQTRGWRWTFWFVVILAGILEIGFCVLYRETYKVQILRQKAKRLRKKTNNPNLQSRYDVNISSKDFMKRSILRPFKMLVSSPIIIILSIYSAVVYGNLYLVLTTITEVFETEYKFSAGSAGLSFLGIGIGMSIAVVSCAFTLDWYLKKKAKVGVMKPEDRLPILVIGGMLIPAGFFIYGWTAQLHIHWIVPIMATAILGFGLIATTIPTSSYIVDAFGIHVASATAASNALKYLAGAVFPLAGPPMYARLGLGWGNSVLGFIALAFVPVPLLLMRYGERIRNNSKFSVKF